MAATKTKSKPKSVLTAKSEAMHLIRSMSDDATLAQIREELAILESINEGIAELDAGLGIPHEDVVNRVKPWRTN